MPPHANAIAAGYSARGYLPHSHTNFYATLITYHPCATKDLEIAGPQAFPRRADAKNVRAAPNTASLYCPRESLRLFKRLPNLCRRKPCQICNGSTTHELGCHNLVLLHPEPCALLLMRPRLSAGRHQEKGFARRSSRMRTAVLCLHEPNSAAFTVDIVGPTLMSRLKMRATSQRSFCNAMDTGTWRRAFEDLGRKPDKMRGMS